ncbi:MAG TPA: AAA family ATPase [Streptosporangiaceae bacterium]|nr:AAA family ATPase [Streptosporangiaceae bacterium]
MSTAEMAREQQYVTMLYGRLDDLREQAAARQAAVLRETGGNAQALVERDVATARYTERLAQLTAAENGLVFGRLDFRDGERRYIGRLGILDETDDYEPLLMDWRAPAARPFYVATAVAPEGVRLRRHIRTRRRTVVALDDEVLDLSAADLAADPAADPAADQADGRAALTGEAALLAALNAGRTGRMSDIVATIQAEQDRVIRADHRGVLVVQGGPGTGKTAVALHRAAYLLYTHRDQLAKRGVLIVGPNANFLRYIGQVLPALGETAVVLSTIAELYPGVSADRAEPAAVAAIKGRPIMAEVVAAAVRDRQWVPERALEVMVDRQELRLSRSACVRVRDRARRARLPHNHARPIVAAAVIDALARQLVDRLGHDPFADDPLGGDDAPGEGANLLGDLDLDEIRRELRGDPAVWAAIDALWPALTPRRLLADLFASPERLAAAAPGLTAAERAALRRAPDAGWTPADVPLLDEAAELLGADDRTAEEAAAERQRRHTAYAQGVLDIIARDVDADPEMLMATDLLDAARLAERHEGPDTRTTAERAATDRSWAFGHVIVDEAQELSEMAWRALLRRCPSRSMTIVGDLAQTGDLAGASSWRRVLEPYVADRWRLAELTVNYRTPAEIMAVAARLLGEVDPGVLPPRSVRETGVRPWRVETSPDELAGRLAEAVAAEVDHVIEPPGTAGADGAGRVAVIVPASRLTDLGDAITAVVPEATVGERADLEAAVVVLTVRQAKGLEFDSVLVAEPARILAESPRGHSDLYVALTRATRRLGVVHAGPPPAPLTVLTQRPPQPERPERSERPPQPERPDAKQAASRRNP